MSRVNPLRQRWKFALVLCLTLIGFSLAGPAQAQSDLPAESLKWVPADAAFYSASLRGREQIEIIAKSNAWKKLKEMPAVQMGLMMFNQQVGQPGGPFDMVKGMMELPENQELIALIKEMFAEEFFVYADASTTDFIDLLTSTINSAQYAPLTQQLEKDDDEPISQEKAQMRAALEVLSEDLERVDAPEVLFGFKISDEKRAQTQIKRLEILAGMALKQKPELADRLKREKIAGVEFLTLNLDGELIPWDEVPWDKAEIEEGEYDDLRDKLKEVTLDISLGVYRGFLLLSIGSSGEHIEKLGEGDLLAKRDELKPLIAAGKKHFTSIGYVSEELLKKVGTSKEDVDSLSDWAELMLTKAELSDEAKEEIVEDVDELEGDIKEMVPELGAILQFSFLTSQGGESFTYNWSENLTLDASKPLTMLSHLGGSPLMAVVARSKHSPESYDTLVEWAKTAWEYFEEYGEEEIPAEHQEKFEQVRDLILPLAKRLDDINRTKLIPALADGQLALVVDNGWSSKAWHKDMPPADKPLPMLEVGIATGVSDAKLLVQAIDGYRQVINDAIAGMKEIEPNTPDFEIPPPKSKKTSAGTIYWYDLPEGNEFDKQLLPSAGVAADVAVISLSQGHTDRLMAKTPLKFSGLLQPTNKPLATAALFDWSGLIEGAKPWIDYAEKLATARDESGQAGFVFQNVRIAVDVLQTLKTITSVSYIEDDVMVTHTQSIWEDAK